MQLQNINSIQIMSSREIASLTGKEHKNILVDIRNLINELGGELKIQPSSYVNEQNKEQPMYSLDKEAILLLTSGYSAKLRLIIIRKLEAMEINSKLPQTFSEALQMAADKQRRIELLEFQEKQLKATINHEGNIQFYQARILKSREEDKHDNHYLNRKRKK
jgi:Rha family phage regulatory protein